MAPSKTEPQYVWLRQKIIKITRKGGELKTYLKAIALILFIVPFLVISTPTAYAFPPKQPSLQIYRHNV